MLDEDDPAAMCHIMNCLFGNNREVPSLPGRISDQEIDFVTFFEACLIIDKYDLYEATCLLMEYWWSIFDKNRPSLVREDLFKRISVAYILDKRKISRS